MTTTFNQDTNTDRLRMNLDLGRRRFLQLGAAGVGGLALNPLLSNLNAFAAPQLGPHDPILVLIEMDGGNDALNMLCPTTQSAYYEKRPTIAIPEASQLAINTEVGLHPNLANIKKRYDNGKVAFIRGVGSNPTDFSHFTSMANWMQGWGGGQLAYPTGWIGRWADSLYNAQNEALYQVVIDQSVPLHHVGDKNQAAGLPLWIGSAFGVERDTPDEIRMLRTLSKYAASGESGRGDWGNEIAESNKALVRVSGKVQPAYAGEFPDDYFAHQMALAANLINANLGIRVLTVRLGGFDTHTNQGGIVGDHANLMKSLDDGIKAFFTKLSLNYRRQTLLMSFSEFGRRPEENSDRGTDHGTAGVVMLIGDLVRGGVYGSQPSLASADLVDYGNLKRYVDFRRVYASVLKKWLRADPTSLLGRSYDTLDFIKAAP